MPPCRTFSARLSFIYVALLPMRRPREVVLEVAPHSEISIPPHSHVPPWGRSGWNVQPTLWRSERWPETLTCTSRCLMRVDTHRCSMAKGGLWARSRNGSRCGKGRGRRVSPRMSFPPTMPTTPSQRRFPDRRWLQQCMFHSARLMRSRGPPVCQGEKGASE